MATLSLEDDDFDTETTERARDGFIDVPPGTYCMKIAATEDVEIKGEKGHMLKIRWQVDDDTNEFHGQSVFQQMIYKHKISADAQRIGRGQIANICDAISYTGPLSALDWDDTLGQQATVTVGWSKPQPGYDRKPEVKSVKPLQQAAPRPAARPAAQTAPKPAAAQAARPAATTAHPATAAPAGANNRPWASRRAG